MQYSWMARFLEPCAEYDELLLHGCSCRRRFFIYQMMSISEKVLGPRHAYNPQKENTQPLAISFLCIFFWNRTSASLAPYKNVEHAHLMSLSLASSKMLSMRTYVSFSVLLENAYLRLWPQKKRSRPLDIRSIVQKNRVHPNEHGVTKCRLQPRKLSTKGHMIILINEPNDSKRSV